MYVPATADAGTETATVGFHEAELTELPVVKLNAILGLVMFTAAAASA